MTSVLIVLVAVQWVVVVALGVVVFALARQVGILFERITPVGAMVSEAGPKIGEATPVFTLASLTGGAVVIGPRKRAALVFFLSPTCPICKALIPALRGVQAAEKAWLDVVLASDGAEDKQRAFVAKAGLDGFPYVLSADLGVTYRVTRLPFAVLIDAAGIVRAKGLVNTREQLDSLFTAAEMNAPTLQSYLKTLSASPQHA